jgi:hypothetical protein
MSDKQLPTWTDANGKEAQAVRITRMVEFEKDRFRIEHDEPHVEPITVGREFVDKAGGLQQEGFYVKDGDGERWVSAAHFQGGYTRQKADYDETPEKGFVSADAKVAGPQLNQVTNLPTPADLAAENQRRLQQSSADPARAAAVSGQNRPGADPTTIQAEQAVQASRAAGAAHAATGTQDLPTSHATETSHSRHPKR